VRYYTYMENTYQVYITRSGDGEALNFGPVVHSLEQASVVVKMLDWLWQQYYERIAAGQDASQWPEAVSYYEGCDVYALDTARDLLYNLNESEEWVLWNASN